MKFKKSKEQNKIVKLFSPRPAASWPNACATFAACPKGNRSGFPVSFSWTSLRAMRFVASFSIKL
jgi:hypothetical protein